MSDPIESDVAEQVTPPVDAPAATPAADASAAREAPQDDDADLEELLAEYAEGQPQDGAGAAQTAEQQPAADMAGVQPDSFVTLQLARWAIAMEDRMQIEQDQRDEAAALTAIRGDIPASVYGNEMIGAWVKNIAQTDPKVQAAWENRAKDPATYKRVIDNLGRRFNKEHGKLPDREATEDREAVAAAVRGASGRAPEAKAPDFSRMTDNEFAAEKDRMFG